MSVGRMNARTRLFPPAVFLAVLVLACAPVSCAKNQNGAPPPLRAGPQGSSADDDTGTQEPDYSECLLAFDYMTSRCGAQFYDDSGGLMTQNDIVKACGRPNAACAVECYRADKTCANLKACLEKTCALK